MEVKLGNCAGLPQLNVDAGPVPRMGRPPDKSWFSESERDLNLHHYDVGIYSKMHHEIQLHHEIIIRDDDQ